jgi:hypothetical protein
LWHRSSHRHHFSPNAIVTGTLQETERSRTVEDAVRSVGWGLYRLSFATPFCPNCLWLYYQPTPPLFLFLFFFPSSFFSSFFYSFFL